MEKQQEDEIKIKLFTDDSKNIILNEDIELHIVKKSKEYIIDVYKYTPKEILEDDDYDSDEDWITTYYVPIN